MGHWVCHWVCHWVHHWVCDQICHGVCAVQVLQHASPAHLTSLTVALDQLDNRYEYDVDYLNGFIRWRVGMLQHACVLSACIMSTTFRCGSETIMATCCALGVMNIGWNKKQAPETEDSVKSSCFQGHLHVCSFSLRFHHNQDLVGVTPWCHSHMLSNM